MGILNSNLDDGNVSILPMYYPCLVIVFDISSYPYPNFPDIIPFYFFVIYLCMETSNIKEDLQNHIKCQRELDEKKNENSDYLSNFKGFIVGSQWQLSSVLTFSFLYFLFSCVLLCVCFFWHLLWLQRQWTVPVYRSQLNMYSLFSNVVMLLIF